MCIHHFKTVQGRAGKGYSINTTCSCNAITPWPVRRSGKTPYAAESGIGKKKLIYKECSGFLAFSCSAVLPLFHSQI